MISISSNDVVRRSSLVSIRRLDPDTYLQVLVQRESPVGSLLQAVAARQTDKSLVLRQQLLTFVNQASLPSFKLWRSAWVCSQPTRLKPPRRVMSTQPRLSLGRRQNLCLPRLSTHRPNSFSSLFQNSTIPDIYNQRHTALGRSAVEICETTKSALRNAMSKQRQ